VKSQRFKHVEKKLAGRLLPTTDAATSGRMGKIRQHGTAPELIVRRALTALEMRYTTHNHDLPGSPDLANRSRRWAVFVHGCYWHRHKGCRKATTPKTNTAFWLAKFAHNRQRDKATAAELRRLGYDVLIIWECEAEAPLTLAQHLKRFAQKAILTK
jgi:DNA mismatch endonuclease, patch repair protein